MTAIGINQICKGGAAVIALFLGVYGHGIHLPTTAFASTGTERPLIDKKAPDTIRTATFAMG